MRAGRISGWGRAVVACSVIFASFVVAAPAGAATVPGMPTGVHATAGDASAVVSWTAPSSNGGSAITGYDIFVTPSGRVIHVTGGTARNATVSALTNGTAYTFKVAARNAVGLGPQSTASAAVTPHVTVSIGDASVWEGTGFPVTASFAVTLRTPAQEAITVPYTVTAGTATAGTDYTGPSSGTLSFAVGQTTKFATQTVVGDSMAEPSETFTVTLSNPTNAILGDATGLGTIRDDDSWAAPSIAVSDATVNEGDAGARSVQLEIRAKANSFPINVNYSMVRGSAEDADFVYTPPQTLQLTGPNTLRTFTVKSDLLKEGDEKFGVYVWSATMSRLDARGVVTIVDNDLTTAPSSPLFPTVTTADVWTPPNPLPPGKPGDVIWSVPTSGSVPANATTRTMLYRSRSTVGDDIAVSGWLTVPTGTPPAGGWPILVWAHWTHGEADNCAPTRSESPTSIPYISDFVAARYVVVASDYEGLGTPGANPYFVSESYAHVLLDSIRAAKKIVPAASNRAVLFGGSEGGIVLTAAAELLPYYAPELNVLGGVGSGAGVAADTTALLGSLARSVYRAFPLAAVAGMNNAFPNAGIPAYYLTPSGISELSTVQTYCLMPLVTTYSNRQGLFQPWLTADPIVPPARSAALQMFEERNSITSRGPAVPMLYVHGRRDSVVLPALLPPFIQRLCDQRATVELRWYDDVHPPLSASKSDVLAWVAARFAGAPAATSCGNIPHAENIPPSVTSIAVADANPTSAASASWTVTFSEAVTGVSSANFSLSGSAAAGASITSVTGSGTTRRVTANTGPGEGLLGLDLSDTSGIIDGAANPLTGPFSGDAYTIDRTAPVVSSIVVADANPTNAASVSWTVTFDEPVTGVGASNFSLSGSAAAGASITGVSGSDTAWTVTATTGPGDGPLGLDLSDPSGIQDLAGNAASGTFTGDVYTVDKTAPTVSSIAPADANPTNAASVSWTVTFDEAVTGVTAANFSLSGSAVAGASITGVTGSDTTWTVTADTGPGDGLLGLDLSDTSGIVDAAANPLNGTFSGDAYTIDKTAPAVSSIVRADANPTSAAEVSWTVTFDEPVTGVDSPNFSLSGSGSSGASITSVTGSDGTWTVTASTGTTGTLELDLSDPTGIQDLAGNASTTTLNGEAYDIQ
jgi:hypothetical protein